MHQFSKKKKMKTSSESNESIVNIVLNKSIKSSTDTQKISTDKEVGTEKGDETDKSNTTSQKEEKEEEKEEDTQTKAENLIMNRKLVKYAKKLS